MKNKDLTSKQLDILKFIKLNIEEKGYPPTVREILASTDIKSTSTVHSHLSILESKGYIKKASSKNRAIEIISNDNEKRQTTNTVAVPIVGRVTAGQPILAQEALEGSFPLAKEFCPKGDLFMLHVEGTSMIDAGIFNGDLVMVRQQRDAENGDIVVALVEDSATIKRYFKMQDHFVLRPENSSMKDIILKEVEILGKVVGLYRTYK